MTIDTITESTARVQYTTLPGQDTYTVPFPFFTDADLVVYASDVEATNYSVIGAGNATGGSVVFDDPLFHGTVVTITRRTSLTRDTTYQQNGPFQAETLNEDFNRLVMIQQEFSDALDRTVRFPASTVPETGELSPIGNFLGKYLRISAAGTLEAADILASGTVLSQTTIGQNLYPILVGETMVVNPFYPYGDIRRYGAIEGGVADCAGAFQAAIDYAQSTGLAVILVPSGRWRIASQLVVTSSITFWAAGIGGPRVYSDPLASYGGPEIIFDKAVSDPFDTGSFAIKVSTGTVGSEGFARVLLRGIGISWTSPNGGGVYAQGAVDVAVEQCWFAGGLVSYDASTQAGICIYVRDAIVSRFEKNTFRMAKYGIIGESYWNENVISRNDFDRMSEVAVLLRGKVSTSIRGSIRDNNFFGDGASKYGVKITGDTRDISIEGNTFEVLALGPIVVDEADHIDATNSGRPTNIRVVGNTFIATNGGAATSAAITLNCDTATVEGNSLKSPSGPLGALLNVATTATKIFVGKNDPGTKPLINGDPTKCAFIDHGLYRSMPRDSSESTKSAWTTDNGGALWWQPTTRVLRLWEGGRATTVKMEATGAATNADTTPSVLGLSTLTCTYSGIATITTLDDGYEGQEVLVINLSASVLTIANGTIALTGATNFAMAQNEAVHLKRVSSGWWELGRRKVT